MDKIEILKLILNEYGTNTIWVVFGIFICWLLYRVLKSKNLLLNPMEKSIGVISDTLTDMSYKLNQSSLNLLNIIEEIAQKQDSHLSDEEVDIITKIVYEYLVYELIEIAFTVFRMKQTNIENIKLSLKGQYESKIINMDRKFFKLPNTNKAIIPTKEKKESLIEKHVYTDIAELIITLAPKNRAEFRSQLKIKLDEIITYWYKR